jgi:hypothetical protein
MNPIFMERLLRGSGAPVVRAGCGAPFNRWFREAANDAAPEL